MCATDYHTAQVLSQHKHERLRHGEAKQQLNSAVGALRKRTEGTSAEHRLQKHTVRHDLVLALADVAAAQGRECMQESRRIHLRVLQVVQGMLKQEVAQLPDKGRLDALVRRLESNMAGLEEEICQLLACKTWTMCSLQLYKVRGQLSALAQHRGSLGARHAHVHAERTNEEEQAQRELAVAETKHKRLHQCLCDAGALNEVLEFITQVCQNMATVC